MSVDYHVLFAATALLWVAVIGFAVLNERPTIHVCVIIVFMTVGQLLLSLQFKKEKQSTILGLVINLMTPALQGKQNHTRWPLMTSFLNSHFSFQM